MVKLRRDIQDILYSVRNAFSLPSWSTSCPGGYLISFGFLYTFILFTPYFYTSPFELYQMNKFLT